jgi:hypothetical protein
MILWSEEQIIESVHCDALILFNEDCNEVKPPVRPYDVAKIGESLPSFRLGINSPLIRYF